MPNAAPTQVMQGIEVPTSSVNPTQFMALTRRLTFQQKQFAYSGLGLTDNVPILQSGIIYGLMVKFSGSLVVTPGTGSVASTARWPYDLPRAFRFSANGQSNLINASGGKMKAREIMARGDLTDRGVIRGIGGASPGTQVQQGTMSLNNEAWGVGSNVTAIANGTYAVELEWYVPVAFDDVTLIGAIFAQTSATDLNLAIDWAPQSDLFVLTGNATVALTGTVTVVGKLCTIPQGPNGQVIVPDLSTFHSLIQTRYTGFGNGVNEIRLAGQGVGKQLLRLYGQLWNGTTPAPVPVNRTNYGQMGWRFGGNDTPELYTDGHQIAYATEKVYDSDLCTYQGFWSLDFASENAFRDSIDEGTATELRFVNEILAAVTLSGTPVIEYVQETASVGSAA
jgi:hypothetical protein